jgi:hypothetical protein
VIQGLPFSGLQNCVYRHLLGILGQLTDLSQGPYLHILIETAKGIHPCLKWDSKPRTKCFSGIRQDPPYTKRPPLSLPPNSMAVDSSLRCLYDRHNTFVLKEFKIVVKQTETDMYKGVYLYNCLINLHPLSGCIALVGLAYIQFSDLITIGKSPWTSGQLVARPLPKRIYTPNIHSLSGIRTHDNSVQTSEDNSCLIPLGYRDRQFPSLV